MIAQVLAARRAGGQAPAARGEAGESRALNVGVCCARIALALALLPALVVVAAVGIVGAAAEAVVGLLMRPGR